ncbi:hypothetical protein ABK040_010795 [Willaertia magna]
MSQQLDTRDEAIKAGGVQEKILFENVTIEDCLEVLQDYVKYPEFLEGNNKVSISKSMDDGKVLDVFWNVTISIKTVEYTLRLSNLPDGVSWSETDHGPFTKNRGGWKLTQTDKGVEALYIVYIEFGIFIPGFIKDWLIGKGLPKTLNSFKKRIEEHAAKKKQQ